MRTTHRLTVALAAALLCLSSALPLTAQRAMPAADTASPVARMAASIRNVERGSGTVASYDAELQALQRLVPEMAQLRARTLPRAQQLDAAILDEQLRNRINELRFRGYLLPLGSRWGFHFSFAGIPESWDFHTVADYDRYIERMRGWRAEVDEQVALMREGIRAGMVMAAAVMKDYDRTASMHIAASPEASAFAEPLRRIPAGIADSAAQRIRREGMAAIESSVLPGFTALARFFREEYVPAARSELGVTALPNGRAYYEHRVRMYTTLDITPEEVHAIGVREVTRIRLSMDSIRQEVGFAGDHAAFVEFLREDPRFTVNTEDAYLQLVSHASKLMDGNLPRLFKNLPRTPYGIRPMPAHVAPRQSAGYYDRGNPDGTRAGWVNINTSLLPSRPTWAARALAFHEGVPGHHLQIMHAAENSELSQIRRNSGVTVFVEGWGLYAERLGLDVGLYDDPYDRFGMWSYQIWRACRLVVDTGMHALGWTRERAIAYMAENTGMTVEAVTAEIDRHITEPGQGLAYTMGELVISELRREAERRLGDRFDIREFHEVVLRNGPLPLPLLRQEVGGWLRDVDREAPR